MRILFLVLFSFFFSVVSASAQSEPENEPGALYLVYDSSGSMWGELQDKSRKYEAGRSALSALLESDLGGRDIAFRAYGHREKADCRDSELVVLFSKPSDAKPKIIEAMTGIRPTGKTPIDYSLREALNDFDGRAGDILLISDGIETCDADPCDLMREWKSTNVNIRVHVVGVGLTDLERQAMTCIAETSGGRYFDADSAEEFSEALTQAGAAIDEPAGEPEPIETSPSYALKIIAKDEQGKRYIATGDIFLNNEDVGDVTTNGRNVLAGPGDYEVEIGPVLRDGSTYKPVRHAVSISEPGEVTVEVIVSSPAIVSAVFKENDEDHPGAFVTAYQDGKEVFGFRAFDEALARPGNYEFRAQPNDDNSLSLTESLAEGEHSVLTFELVNTIQFYIEFVLPNGDTFNRGSELWRDGERVYSVYGSNNPTTIIPGVYELRADDQNLPLTPVEIEITEDGKTYQVPVEAGWVTIRYNPSEYYVKNPPNNAFLESVDRGKSKYSRVDTPIPVKPGAYKVNPRTEQGFMDPIEVIVGNNESVEVAFTPKPVGKIVVNYAPSDNWTREPDRAFVYPLEEQRIIKGYMTPGRAAIFAPGRYRVVGGGSGGADALEQEVVVTADEETVVTLEHKDD